MRWMARMSPLVWWWAQADPSFSESFNGFVWEEASSTGRAPFPAGKGEQIVGNVSLNRAPGSHGRWIVCNVAVQAGHRGRGIGRRLTEAAIVEAQNLGARGVVIQVYEDNAPALQLYSDLNFHEAAAETGLRLEAVKPVDLVDAAGYRLRAWRPADGQSAYDLARLVTPSAQQWVRPVNSARYRLGWWTRVRQGFGDLLRGRRVYRLIALREDRLVAMMTVTAAVRQGDHRLELLVHPDHAGRVEAALVSRALHMLAAIPSRPVRATVDRAQGAVLEALSDYRFKEGRTLLTLRQDFA
jgi:ribosomal protein S18 acetylase RimI-like enzyme